MKYLRKIKFDEFLEKVSKNKIILLIIILLGLAFYGYIWRPHEITKNCRKYANESTTADAIKGLSIGDIIKFNDFIYTSCLRSKGL